MKIKFPYTKELKEIAKIFLQKGDEIRLVGGCVRNILMKKPITDFDLACIYPPEQVMAMLKKAGVKAIPTGFEHGTVTAIINKIPFEITTLRKDIEPLGRHAKVKFTDNYEEDANRRDFTINAIYLDFNGNIYDYFNGIKDIETGNIQFIGKAEDRIKEDYLRILRFFRFYCHYGLILDKNGLEACKKFKDKIKGLSGERIRMEIFKILLAPSPVETLQIMQDNGILQEITNNIEFDFEKLSLFNTIQNKLSFKADEIFILVLLLKEKDSSKETKDYFKKHWKLTNKEYKNFSFLLNKNITNSKDKIKKYLFKLGDKQQVTNLFVLDYFLTNRINQNSAKEINETIKFIQNYKIPVLPITGQDLIKIGFKEGKKLGDTLKKAKKMFIENDYKIDKQTLLKNVK